MYQCIMNNNPHNALHTIYIYLNQPIAFTPGPARRRHGTAPRAIAARRSPEMFRGRILFFRSVTPPPSKLLAPSWNHDGFRLVLMVMSRIKNVATVNTQLQYTSIKH